MIITDFSNIAITAIMSNGKKAGTTEFTDNFCYNAVLGMLRNVVKKHKHKYGKTVVIACDHPVTWRKDYFPHYKARRAAKRDDHYDWEAIMAARNKLQLILKEAFPYRVVCVEGAEGDDVVAAIAKATREKSVIVARDKDFFQLIRPGYVDMFDPVEWSMVEGVDPALILKEQIIRGDAVDDVPNILSDDDTFVDPKKRQKSMTKGPFERLMGSDPSTYDDVTLNRYLRNKTLIDLSQTPKHIVKAIYTELVKPPEGNLEKVKAFLMQQRLVNLIEGVTDFV